MRNGLSMPSSYIVAYRQRVISSNTEAVPIDFLKGGWVKSVAAGQGLARRRCSKQTR